MKHKSKVIAASAAIAVGLSLLTATPAEACQEPQPSPAAGETISTADTVRVTQQAPGSYFGVLEWPAVAGATEYRIFKTGSIRPAWRLFWIASGSVTKKTVSDKPRSIAIYRVAALVNNREIDLGEFIYIPVR